MQDFMRLYSGIVERCFLACAQDFSTKALTSNEVSVGGNRTWENDRHIVSARGSALARPA